MSVNDGKLSPTLILVLNDLGVGLHHLVERSRCHQKLHFHILKLQEVRFDVATMINSSFIQDHQGCETLGGAGTQPHHHFLCGNFCFCMTPTFFIGISNLLSTHVHFQNYRHHQCQRIFRQKTEFLRCLLFGNLFEASLQTVSV